MPKKIMYWKQGSAYIKLFNISKIVLNKVHHLFGIYYDFQEEIF